MIQRPRPAEVAAAILIWLGLLLSGCSDSSEGGGAPAGTNPSAATSSDPGDAGSDAPPHLAGDDTRLAPGVYQFSFATNPGVQTPDALVKVPSGFDDGGDWFVVSHDSDAFLGLWTVGKVQRDACLRPRNDYVTPGSSVEDLADALVAQKSTRASAPKPVTVAGYRGLYVELASPRDISRCDQTPRLWGDPGERGIYSDDQIDLVWILDVDGQRLVVNAAHGPTATTSEIDNLTSMVMSLEFAAAPG
jgi:hypothetical protein